MWSVEIYFSRFKMILGEKVRGFEDVRYILGMLIFLSPSSPQTKFWFLRRTWVFIHNRTG